MRGALGGGGGQVSNLGLHVTCPRPGAGPQALAVGERPARRASPLGKHRAAGPLRAEPVCLAGRGASKHGWQWRLGGAWCRAAAPGLPGAGRPDRFVSGGPLECEWTGHGLASASAAEPLHRPSKRGPSRALPVGAEPARHKRGSSEGRSLSAGRATEPPRAKWSRATDCPLGQAGAEGRFTARSRAPLGSECARSAGRRFAHNLSNNRIKPRASRALAPQGRGRAVPVLGGE